MTGPVIKAGKATGILLAGGKSRRFGSDKTLLTWNGVTIVEHLALQLRSLFDEVLIVGNAAGRFAIPGVREAEDKYPDSGPLGGIHAGLSSASCEWGFVTACDMPFFDAGLARRLLGLADDCDAVVPIENKIFQTLFAVYNRSVLPTAEQMLRGNERAVYSLCCRVRTKYLDLEEAGDGILPRAGFYNINFPEDCQPMPVNTQ